MKQYLGPLLASTVVATAAIPAWGMEELLVTGSYSAQQELTSSVAVLDAERIGVLNKRTLSGLLKTVPGLLVEEQGGPGGLTAVSVRGGEANFTLVLLDGVPVNDPTNTRGGGFDFANLNSALVERVEVVRGAASAVYGSDALAGVINIVTRRPATGYRESLSVELGEDDYQQFSVSALGREGVFDYTVEIATRDDGEPVPGSARDSDSANLRLGWQPDERHDLTFNFRYLEGDRSSYPEQSGGPEFAAIDALDEAHYEDQVLGVTWDLQVSPGWRSRLSLTRFDHEEDYTSPGIVPFDAVPPNAAATDFTRDQLQWVNSIEPAPGYRLDVGADYRDEQGDSSGYLEFSGNRLATDFELDRDVAGAFAALSARPLDRLLLNGGVRYDDPDGFDGEVSWSVGAKVEAGAGLTLSANLAEAFKLPSFFALGNALVGNPALQPEYSASWDAGVAWRGGSGLLLAATWFANEFEDLVDFDSTLFKNVNRGRVETSGVELEALLPLAADLALRANGTWTDIDVGGQDTVLTGRPEWSAGMVVDWRLSPAWQLALDYRFSGRQWAASRYTGEEQTLKLDAYHRVDSVLHWTPTARWRLQLSVDNLLDEDYETAVGFPAPGRGVRVGITFSP